MSTPARMEDGSEFAIRRQLHTARKIAQVNLFPGRSQRPAIGQKCLTIALETGELNWSFLDIRFLRKNRNGRNKHEKNKD